MHTHVNPLKPLAALSLLLLLAAAPLQQAHGLGEGKVSGAPAGGGTLRDESDEDGQAAEDAPQNQDDAGGDPSAEAPDEAEPEAASDESSEATDESEESADQSEDSTDDVDSEDEDSEDKDE